MIRVPKLEKWVIFSLAFFFIAETFAGPLRFYLSHANQAELFYLPKIILTLGVLLYLIKKSFVARKTHLAYLVLVVIMIWGALYGYVNFGNINQVAFGVWVFIPFLAGVILGNEVIDKWPDWKSFIFLLWGFQVIGIIVNYFVTYPWEGTFFSLAGMELRSAKLWYGLGVRRLAGLGRASAITADQLLIFSVLLLGTKKKRKSYSSIIIWVLTLIAIVLTTNKTAILAVLFVGLLWLVWKISSRVGRLLLRVSILGTSLILIVLPIFAFLINNISNFSTTPNILNSFISRISITWPNLFIFISEQAGIPLLGNGIGGTGTALKLFNPNLKNNTDNLSVYLYASFGVIGLLLIFLCILSLISSGFKNQRSFTVGVLALVVFTMGITSNVVESPFTSFVFGVLLWNSSSVISSRIKRNAKIQKSLGIVDHEIINITSL
jgi:hypothetical protein